MFKQWFNILCVLWAVNVHSQCVQYLLLQYSTVIYCIIKLFRVAGRESLRDSYVIVALATDPVSRRPMRTELLDETQTMEQLGLIPNALLHLKRKKLQDND